MRRFRAALLLAPAFLAASTMLATAQSIDVLDIDVDANVDLGGGVDLSVDVGGGGPDSVLGLDATVDLGAGNDRDGGLDSTLDDLLGVGVPTGGVDARLDTLLAFGSPGTANNANAAIDALVTVGGTPGSSIGGLDLDDILAIINQTGGSTSMVDTLALGGAPGNSLDLDLAILGLGASQPGGPGAPGTPGSPGLPPGNSSVGGGGGGGGASGVPGAAPALPNRLLALWTSLNADQQRRLIGQCLTIVAQPSDFRRDWVDLCRHVGSLPGVSQVFVAAR